MNNIIKFPSVVKNSRDNDDLLRVQAQMMILDYEMKKFKSYNRKLSDNFIACISGIIVGVVLVIITNSLT
ncbi:hypothetical protein CMI47_19435 [Candidatus Pacearchaeota archaeon]|nr:hypothetical protein [Candidatus Pacearchaeota archaeon]|tara:strand:+ start:206 stop:415 length:210 start_codon:yes stop_codon:yes gene_type:complete